MSALPPAPGEPGVPMSTEAAPAVRIAPSAPLGVLVLGLLLALGPASRAGTDVGGGIVFLAGLLAAAAAFAALTASEAATAWRARRLGLPTGPVVVAAWGPSVPGAGSPRSWQQARRLGAFKPLVGLGAAAALLLSAAAAVGAGWTPFAAALTGAALLTAALAVLELLPGPGRSGGLLVLARVWRRSDRLSAERAVARVGIRTGWSLVALGFVAILVAGPAGLWLTLVGWLTLLQSRIEQARTLLHGATAAVPARAAMTPGAPEVTGWHSVETVLAEVGPTPYEVLPLRRFDGSLSAVLVSELYAVPGDDRDLKRAQDLARPVLVLGPDEPVERLLGAAAGALPLALVVADGTVLGVIGPAELTRLVAGATAAPGGPNGPFHAPEPRRNVWDR